MWEYVRRLCTECFLGKSNTDYQFIQLKEAPDTPVSTPNSRLAVPFEQRMHEAQDLFTRYLRMDRSAFECLASRHDLTVYGKDLDCGFLTISEWNTQFTPREFLDFFCNADARLQWDATVAKVVHQDSSVPGFALTYTLFKKVPLVSQRDLLIASAEQTINNGLALVSLSVENDEFPEKLDVIRMHVEVGGHYFEPQANGTFNVTTVAQCSLGGSIPKSLVKKLFAANMPKFVNSLRKALQERYPC